MPLALLTTPYGLTIADYYRSVLDNPVLTARVGEWHPATFGGPSTQFVIVLLAAIGLLGFGYGRGFRPPLFMVGLTFALALARRPRGALPGLVRVRGHAADRRRDERHVRVVGVAADPAHLCAGGAGRGRDHGCGQLAAAGRHRHGAVRGAVAAPRHGRDGSLGGRASAGEDHGRRHLGVGVLWTHPERTGRVGFDSRYEIYSQRQLLAYTDWVAGNGSRSQWSRVLNGYDEVLLSTAYRQNVIDRMRTLPGWHRIYGDADGVVFVRDAAG